MARLKKTFWQITKNQRKVKINSKFLSSTSTQLAVFCFAVVVFLSLALSLSLSQVSDADWAPDNYQVLNSLKRCGTKMSRRRVEVPPTAPDQAGPACSRSRLPRCTLPDAGFEISNMFDICVLRSGRLRPDRELRKIHTDAKRPRGAQGQTRFSAAKHLIREKERYNTNNNGLKNAFKKCLKL